MVVQLDFDLCHCEEGAQVRDAAIHRGSEVDGRGCLFAYWFTVDRHGLRPRDDKVKGKDVVVRLDCDLCHCEEGAQVRDAAIHRVFRGGER